MANLFKCGGGLSIRKKTFMSFDDPNVTVWEDGDFFAIHLNKVIDDYADITINDIIVEVNFMHPTNIPDVSKPVFIRRSYTPSTGELVIYSDEPVYLWGDRAWDSMVTVYIIKGITVETL